MNDNMIAGSVKPPETTMTEYETMEAFVEGSKKAATAAHELAIACNSVEWTNVVETLNSLRDGVRRLNNMRSMSRLETMMAANAKIAPYKPN